MRLTNFESHTPLAQRSELVPYKDRVEGSNPSGRTVLGGPVTLGGALLLAYQLAAKLSGHPSITDLFRTGNRHRWAVLLWIVALVLHLTGVDEDAPVA